METPELLKLLLTPPDKIAQMEALIDLTSFDVIKRYKEQDPSFDRVFNVTNKDHLGIVRITSYNVCYTKLLRVFPF